MKRKCENIYKIARNNVSLTQEQAAELLHISPRTLSDYESGKTIPGDDLVFKMIEVYGADWLAYEHLKQSRIGKKYLPDIEFADLPKSVLRLQKEVRDFEVVSNEIIDIACVGTIESYKSDRWRNIVEKINEMVGAALSVVFHQEAM